MKKAYMVPFVEYEDLGIEDVVLSSDPNEYKGDGDIGMLPRN